MWVGGCVTAPTAWASPPGRRTQECTQIGKNGLSVPFWGICVHCCAVVDNRGDAGVYTDRPKWPLGAVLGHLCTLLRRESRYESRRELRQVARAPQPPRRAGGAPLLAPPAWSGSASGAAARLASSPGCQPTRTPEEPISYGGSAVLWGVETPWRREAL